MEELYKSSQIFLGVIQQYIAETLYCYICSRLIGTLHVRCKGMPQDMATGDRTFQMIGIGFDVVKQLI